MQNFTLRFRRLASACGLALTLWAGPGLQAQAPSDGGGTPAQNPRPDTEVQLVAPSTIEGPAFPCGAVRRRADPGYTLTVRFCPRFITKIPAHSRIVWTPGSGTRAILIGQARVHRTEYECVRKWLLFVPLGLACVPKRTFVSGTVPRAITALCPQ